MKKKISIVLVFLFLISTNSLSIEPDIFVQSTVNRASKTLSENLTKEEKIDQLKKIALETVDIKGIGFYTLGPIRKTLTEDQKSKYSGLFTEWYSNGNKACELHYRNGLLNGLAKWWYRSGYKKKQVSYKNNKEVDGSKRYWYYKMDETSGGAHYHFKIENDA